MFAIGFVLFVIFMFINKSWPDELASENFKTIVVLAWIAGAIMMLVSASKFFWSWLP